MKITLGTEQFDLIWTEKYSQWIQMSTTTTKMTTTTVPSASRIFRSSSARIFSWPPTSIGTGSSCSKIKVFDLSHYTTLWSSISIWCKHRINRRKQRAFDACLTARKEAQRHLRSIALGLFSAHHRVEHASFSCLSKTNVRIPSRCCCWCVDDENMFSILMMLMMSIETNNVQISF